MTRALAHIVIRPLRPDEVRLYLKIVGRAIRGLAGSHYAPDAIEGWIPPLTEDSVRDTAANPDGEIRLIAQRNDVAVGIGALVPAASELRAVYVLPEAARRGVGRALVDEIERLARQHGLTHLELAGSLNAEPFYASLGYHARDRSDVVLRNGVRLPCVWMDKELSND